MVVQGVYWEFQAGGIRRADGTTAMAVAPPRVCVLMAGLSWVPWLLSCTTGVQPHPARVQSVWLRPGEAVNQPSTTHTPHTPSTIIFTPEPGHRLGVMTLRPWDLIWLMLMLQAHYPGYKSMGTDPWGDVGDMSPPISEKHELSPPIKIP